MEKSEQDAPEKRAVFAFGRFNPPTKGHGKMIEKAVAEGKKHNADVFIFPSQTVDKKKDPAKSKNPLDWKTKISFMKRLWPDVNIVEAAEVKSPWNVLEYLSDRGYTDVVIVAGQDRVPEYETRLAKYALEVFKSFAAVSAGTRDPDDDKDVTGMSATKARIAAREGDIGKFRAATGWSSEIVEQMMKAVRAGMGIK